MYNIFYRLENPLLWHQQQVLCEEGELCLSHRKYLIASSSMEKKQFVHSEWPGLPPTLPNHRALCFRMRCLSKHYVQN